VDEDDNDDSDDNEDDEAANGAAVAAAAAAAANIDKDGGECDSAVAVPVIVDPADAAAVANTLVREEKDADISNAGDPNAPPPNAGLPLVMAAGDAGTDANGGGVRCPAVDETVEGADDRDEADEVCDDTEDDSGEMGGDELEASDEAVWEKYVEDAEKEEDAEDGDAKERSAANGDASCRTV
jgi:hypothetical protein